MLEEKNVVTKQEIKELINKTERKIDVTDEAVELICEAMNDPEFDGFKFSETMITYQNVLDNCKGSLVDYINAIKFCSYLDANEGNYTDAYIKTFFKRDFVQDRYKFPTGSEEYKQLTSASARYRKTKMVVAIMTQSQVPFHILFQGYRYKAINRLVYEMDNAHLPKDRINAAKEILNFTAPPENYKIEIDLNKKEDNVIDRYENALKKLVEEQSNLISNGKDIKSVANVNIVEAQIVDE